MNMYLGELMSTPEENSYDVITEVQGKRITKKESLQEYVAKNTMIEYQGEYKTLKEVLDMHCEEYMRKHEVLF